MSRILVLAFSIFAQAAGGETLIASGNFEAAGVALEKATIARIEDAARNGLSPRSAVRQLATVFTTPADQTYLRSLAGAGPEADRPVKLRALERTKTGYRVTAPNGHVAEFALNAKTHRNTIGGHDLPPVSAGAEAYFRALDHELGTAKFARLNLLSLFGSDDATAFVAAVPVGVLILVGLVAAVGVVAVAAETVKRLNPSTVGDYLGQMTRLCERERVESREPFDKSESGKFLKLMAEQNVLDSTSGERIADCPGMVDRLFAKNTETIKGFHKITRGNVNQACLNAADFASCVKDYRKRDAAVGVPAPAKTTEPGVAGAAR